MEKLNRISKYSTPLFFLVLLAISLIYDYHKILFLRPESIHQWRQTDSLSITLNYLRGGFNFFNPKMHCMDGAANVQAVSEFPIIYYLVAILWKIFGYHEFIFRLVSLSFFFSGLLALHQFFLDLLKDTFWAIAITALVFTSPVIAIYANNFIPDVPSLSLNMIAWYFFWKFFNTSLQKYFVYALLFFLFACLIKVTSAICLVAIIGIYVFESLGIMKFKDSKIFKNKISPIFGFILVFIPVFAWFSYAKHYNNIHQSNLLFLLEVIPIWKIETEELKQTLRLFYDNLIPQLFNNAVYTAISLMFLTCLLFYKKTNKLLFFMMLFVNIGAFAYAILFFKNFNVHDYYMVLFLNPIIFILICFFDLFHRHYQLAFIDNKVKIIFSAFLLFNIYICSLNTKIRYYDKRYFMLNKQQADFWSWFHWDYDSKLKKLETITPYLRSLGIMRDDIVMSFPDQSPNISLYLMDQRGYTDFLFGSYAPEDKLARIKSLSVKYIILNDANIAKEAYFQPYLNAKIGTFGNVTIYDLSKLK
jgi:Dolichyl-phosphate-mannose-protein mannosyltransferase